MDFEAQMFSNSGTTHLFLDASIAVLLVVYILYSLCVFKSLGATHGRAVKTKAKQSSYLNSNIAFSCLQAPQEVAAV